MPNQIGEIKKTAQILGAIETYIYENSKAYLPRQRSRFIDLCTISLTEFEDDFFTYDQLKNLVVNRVTQCEASSAIKWRIDVDNCTADQAAAICQPSQKRFVMPLRLFMASALTWRCSAKSLVYKPGQANRWRRGPMRYIERRLDE